MKPFPKTPRLNKLLLLAERISRKMGWNYVDTEHVLLALFKIENGLGKTIPEILRQQAEIHCRGLHFLAVRDTVGRKATFKVGERNSPPYWEAASLFIKDNATDPLRTEIVWLRSQFEWAGDQE